MTDNNRRNDWQVIGAVALIALGAWLLLSRFPWWGMVSRAFGLAFDFAWPVALIGLGALLLLSAQKRHEWYGGQDPQQSGDSRGAAHRVMRSRSDRMVGGVLGGIGNYLGIDSTWVRVGYVVLAVFAGVWSFVLLYIIALVLIPEEPRAGAPESHWPGQWSAPVPPQWTEQGPRSTETVQTPPVPDASQPPVPPGEPSGWQSAPEPPPHNKD